VVDVWYENREPVVVPRRTGISAAVVGAMYLPSSAPGELQCNILALAYLLNLIEKVIESRLGITSSQLQHFDNLGNIIPALDEVNISRLEVL
jgi:hypothetical protein